MNESVEEITDECADNEDIEELVRQIAEIKSINKMKDEMIAEKDEQIETLQKQINELKVPQKRAMTSDGRRSQGSSDSEAKKLLFWKQNYESALLKYQGLQEALSVGARKSHPVEK